MNGSTQAWHLIWLSTLLTVLGSFIIWADVLVNKLFRGNWSILENRQFLIATLGISGGVLLVTALHSLLANAIKYFRLNDLTHREAEAWLLVSVLIGFIVCLTINFVIHSLTSQSVVHCAHDGDVSHAHEVPAHHHAHSHGSSESGSAHAHFDDYVNESAETTPLVTREVRHFLSTDNFRAVDSVNKSLIDKLTNKPTHGECRGFESIYHCSADFVRPAHGSVTRYTDEEHYDDGHHHHHTHDDVVHHHHVVPHGSNLLSIGLQTAFAITIHKLPEGFLLFATEREDERVGLHIFVALAIHNFFEGFTISCPLYLALGSRWLAVFCAAILGGGAQPVGALLAVLFFKGKLDQDSYHRFGMLIGATAGFMIIISLQMICTAVEYGGSSQKVVLWTIAGMLIVLASNCL